MAGAAQKIATANGNYLVDTTVAAGAIPRSQPRTESRHAEQLRDSSPRVTPGARYRNFHVVGHMLIVAVLAMVWATTLSVGHARQEAEINRRSALKHQLNYQNAISLQLREEKASSSNTIYIEHQAKLAGMTIPDSRTTVVIGRLAP
jgi:hypothetical protein